MRIILQMREGEERGRKRKEEEGRGRKGKEERGAGGINADAFLKR